MVNNEVDLYGQLKKVEWELKQQKKKKQQETGEKQASVISQSELSSAWREQYKDSEDTKQFMQQVADNSGYESAVKAYQTLVQNQKAQSEKLAESSEKAKARTDALVKQYQESISKANAAASTAKKTVEDSQKNIAQYQKQYASIVDKANQIRADYGLDPIKTKTDTGKIAGFDIVTQEDIAGTDQAEADYSSAYSNASKATTIPGLAKNVVAMSNAANTYTELQELAEIYNAQAKYVRDNASDELAEQLQAQLAFYDQSKEDGDSAKAARLRELLNLNNYYQAYGGKTADMTDAEFQTYYSGYTRAKETSDSYKTRATETMQEADAALNRGDSEAYTRLMAQAKSLQRIAEASLGEYADMDETVAYAIEQRATVSSLEAKVQDSKNANARASVEKFVALGKQKNWVPQLREWYANNAQAISNAIQSTALGATLTAAPNSDRTSGIGQAYIDLMTDDQKETLYYYLGKNDYESAQAYFSALEPTLEQKYSEETQAQMAEAAADSPVWGTVANALLNATIQPILGTVATIENAARELGDSGAPAITGGAVYTASDLNQGTTLGLTENIQKSFNTTEETAQFWSGVIVSMANNAAQTALFRGASAAGAVAGKLDEWVPLALMATNAATDTVRQQLASGSNLGQAMIYGGIVGAAEMLTEKLGLEQWMDLTSGSVGTSIMKHISGTALDRAGLRATIKGLLGLGEQALSEGTEEVISGIVSGIADIAINGSNSTLARNRAEYIAQGYSEEEATRLAWKAFADDVTGSFLAGAVSGAGFGTVYTAINIPAEIRNGNAIGQAVLNMGRQEVQALVAAGTEYASTTTTYKTAQALAAKMKASEDFMPTASQLTTLSLAMEQDSQTAVAALSKGTTGSVGNTMSVTASGLISTGVVTANEARVMDLVLNKVAAGDHVTDAEIHVLKASAPAIRTKLSELMGVEIANGSDGAVRAAIQVYQAQQAEAVRQQAAQVKARQTIQTAVPLAKSIERSETEAAIESARQTAEAEAGEVVAREVADRDAQISAQAEEDAAGMVSAIDEETDTRDSVKHLNYPAFSAQYKAENPTATSDEIREAYEIADRESAGAVRQSQQADREALRQVAREEYGVEPTEEELDVLEKDVKRAQTETKSERKQYSINENFASDIDEWVSGGQGDNEVFMLGSTGDVLQGLGAIESDIYINSEKVNNIMATHPEMTLDVIKKIPEILDDPILILKSIGAGRGNKQNSRMVVYGSVRTEDGTPVLSVLDLRPVENSLEINDMQKVVSSYIKTTNPVDFISRSDVLFADKKRTTSLLRTIGFQMPITLQHSGSIGSITYRGSNVKLEGMPFREAVQVASASTSTSSEAETKPDVLDRSQLSLANETKDEVLKLNSGKPGKYSKENPNLLAEWITRDFRRVFGTHGMTIEVRYDLPDNVNGMNENGKIVLNGQKGDTTVDGTFMAAQDYLTYILSHEVGHSAQGNTKSGYEAQTDSIIKMYRELNPEMTDDQLEERINKELTKNRNYARKAELEGRDVGFKASEFGRQDALEEVACNMLGELMVENNVLNKMLPQHQSIIQKVKDRVSEALGSIRKMKPKASKPGEISIPKAYELAAEGIEQTLTEALEAVQGKTKTATEGGVQMSLNSYREAVDDIVYSDDAKPFAHRQVLFGDTPQNLLDIGFEQLPMMITSKHIYTMANKDGRFNSPNDHYHNLGADRVKQLPDAIREPIVTYAQKDNPRRVTLVTQMLDESKNPVMVAIEFAGRTNYNEVSIFSNFVTTGYGKKESSILNEIVSALDDGRILQADKERSQRSPSDLWAQCPEGLWSSDFNDNIQRFKDSVKRFRPKEKQIRNANQAVNTQFSLSDEDQDYLVNEFGEQGRESAFDRFGDNTLEDGTVLMSKAQSITQGRDLKSKYHSRANTEALATMYRRLSQVSVELSDGYLKQYQVMAGGVQSDFDKIAENNLRIGEEMERMAYEIADAVIDGAAQSGREYSEEVLAAVRDALDQPIYVAEEDKQTFAETLSYESWGEARKARLNILGKTTNDPSKGVEVASIYEALVEQFPGAVKQGIRSQADQLKAIIDTYDDAIEAKHGAYNPLAYSAEVREQNRKDIADNIVSEMVQSAYQYAEEQYQNALSAEKAKARRLEREAKEAEAKAAEAAKNNAEPELVKKLETEGRDLREQAEEAKLMGQTDSETIMEGMAEGGYRPQTAEDVVAAWAKQSKTQTDLTPEQVIELAVKRVMQRKDRQPGPKVSQTYSNTLVGGGLISEVERTMEGLRPQDMTYDPKTEKQSLTEAAARLDSDYLKWYGALPNKEAWTGVDLDTAMLILGQVQAEAENSGDFSTVARWAQLIKERTSQNAQMLQSLAKYSRTAVGMVADAARNLDETYVNESGDSKALRSMRKSNQKNADKLDEVTAKNDELEAEYQKLREQFEAIKTELEAARKEGRSLDSKVETAKNKLLKAIDTLDKQHKLSAQLTGELERLMDSLSWKLAELSNVSRDNRNVLMEKRKLERRIDAANNRYQEALEENRTLRTALDGLRNLGLTAEDINHLTEIVESQNEYMDKILTVLANQKTAAARANSKAGSTQSAAARKRAATETASEEVNAMARAVQDDLDTALSADRKAKLISDMAEFASILDATKEGDKDRLIQLIIQQSERRNIKVSKTIRRWLQKQEWQYLHDFAVTQLANIADDYIPRTAGKKMATWQYLAQLLNVKTSLRNVISNAVFYAQEGFAKNLGAMIDLGISAATKTRTVGFSTVRRGDTGRLAGAAERAQRAGLEVSLDVAVGNSFSKYGEGSTRTFKMAQKGISHAVGRVLSRAEKVNGYSLTVTDEYFKGAVYQSTVNSLASLVAKGKLSQQEAEDIAQRQILYNTFQDETFVGRTLNTLHDSLNSLGTFFKEHDVPVLRKLEGIGLGDFVIKYRTVPGALVTRALEYSPAGYLKMIYNVSQLVRYGSQSKALEQQMRTDGRNSVSEDNIAEVRANFIKAQNNVSMGFARATTGSGLVAAFWALALNGIIGNADDEEDKDAKAVNTTEGLSGTQINIDALERFINGQSSEWQEGDDLIDIGFLDPTGSTITMGTMIANMEDAEGENWFSKWYNANKGMALQSFSDLSMMDTLNDLLYTFMYHDDESDLDIWTEMGITFATSMVTSMEPSLIRQLAQASDEYYRDTYGGSGAIYDATRGIVGEETAEALQTAANEIAVNIPGLRQMVDTKLDSFGREKTYGESTAANVLNALVNPAKYAKYNPSEASRELRRLYRETGDASIYPDRNAPSSVQFGNERVSLTPDQKRTWQTTMGTTYDSMLGEMMSGEAYQDANNERKVEMLNDLESYVEYKAKQGIYSETHGGQTYVNDDWNKTEAGMDIGIAFGDMRQILNDTSETNMPSDVEDGETVSGSREGKIMDYLNDLDYSDKVKLNLYGIIRGSGATSSTEKLRDIVQAGLSFEEATAVRKVYNELNASRDANASSMSDRDVFEQYLRDQGFSASERKVINTAYKFYTQIPQDENSIITKLTDGGMDYDTSYDIAARIEALEPENGEETVTSDQKYSQIIGDNKLSTYEKQQTIAAISGSGSAFGSLNENVAGMLMNVYESTGVTSVLSIQPADSITVNYKEYEYNDAQKEASTNAYIEIMNQMGGGYLTDAKLVSGAKDIAANAARYAALTEGGYEPDLDDSDYSAYRKALQAQDVGLDLSYYVAVKAAGNEFTADTDADGKTISGSKKAKVVSYLKGLGLSNAQYNFFYSTVFGYK